MPPTVRRLLSRSELGLSLLTPPSAGVDVPLQWVHSSDLADPTPFLSPGQMLLTTGTQFPPDAMLGQYMAYVERLSRAGVRALGFGTEVIRSGTPAELLESCLEAGIPLVEVPYRTPFLAIIRWAAEVIAAEERERDTWALQTQRAVSLAALGDGGLDAALRVAARELDRTIVLLDDEGEVGFEHPPGGLGGARRTEVLEEARRLLARRQRGSSALVAGRERVALQTLGRAGRLRGVLVTSGGAEWDSAAQAVVTAVAALVELSLEQGVAQRRILGALRGRAAALAIEGHTEAGLDMASALGAPLPPPPLRVVAVRPGPPAAGNGRVLPSELAEALDRLAAEQPAALATVTQTTNPAAAQEPGPALLLLRDEAAVRGRLHRLLLGSGGAGACSEPVELSALPSAAAEALALLGRLPAETAGLREAAAPEPARLPALLSSPELTEAAQRVLGPIAASREGAQQLRCARVWLEHNGQWDPAARELGLHRHSLKARIVKLESALGFSLEGFAGRAQLWALLQAMPVL